MPLFIFEHGDEVKETVTGYVGVVTGRSDFFNGCKRYMVESKKLKEDGQTNELWFDEARLELKKVKKLSPTKPKNPQGPQGTKHQY